MKKTQRKQSKTGRRGKGVGALRGLTKSPCILPSTRRGLMFYDQVVSISPTVGTVGVNVYRMNSVYDPDLTGVGANANLYGAFSGIYGRYRVLACKIYVGFCNISNAALTVFVAATPATTVGTNINQILSQRHVWSRSIGTQNGNGTIDHVLYAPIHEIYGVPAIQVKTEDDFASVTGANPNNGVYAHIGAYAHGFAGTVNIIVRLEYDVVWSLPLEMS